MAGMTDPAEIDKAAEEMRRLYGAEAYRMAANRMAHAHLERDTDAVAFWRQVSDLLRQEGEN